MGEILDGRAIAERVLRSIAARVGRLREKGITPGLSVVLVGRHPASEVYVRGKLNDCERVGIRGMLHRLPEDVAEENVLGLVAELNADPNVHGVLVQLPLPPQVSVRDAVNAVDPAKDVDGFHAVNAGQLVTDRQGLVPCAAKAVMRLLEESGVELRGKHAAVVGRSRVVGRPMAAMLLAADATVTIGHRHSRNLAELTSMADVLVVAVGKAGLVTADWVKPGAVVIDVGISRLGDGSLSGDVRFEEVLAKASLLTPVPGGVGPMTKAMVLENTCEATERLTGAIEGT